MTKKYDNEMEGYVKFLEDAASIDVASDYAGNSDAEGKIKNWKGDGPFPSTFDHEDISAISAKLTQSPSSKLGLEDPNRDSDDDEECSECDEKIQEIYRELGLSPLDLLESDDGDSDDEDDDDDDEDGDDEEDEDEEDDDDDEEEGEAAPASDVKTESYFTNSETKILEQLISEMGLMEDELMDLEESMDEFSDDFDYDDIDME